MRKKNIPTFDNEEQEREFWATHDSTDYIDWEKAEQVSMPKLKKRKGSFANEQISSSFCIHHKE